MYSLMRTVLYRILLGLADTFHIVTNENFIKNKYILHISNKEKRTFLKKLQTERQEGAHEECIPYSAILSPVPGKRMKGVI